MYVRIVLKKYVVSVVRVIRNDKKGRYSWIPHVLRHSSRFTTLIEVKLEGKVKSG